MKKLLLIGALTFGLNALGQTNLRYNIDEIKLDSTEMMAYVIDTEEPVTGIVFDLWPNGNLKSERECRNGKKSGVHKKWFEDGSLEAIGMFKDNKMDGVFLRFYEGGQTFEETWMENDLPVCLKRYYPSGQLVFEYKFENGEFVSGSCWDENGEEKECPKE